MTGWRDWEESGLKNMDFIVFMVNLSALGGLVGLGAMK